MKKQLLIIFLFSIIAIITAAQNTWTQKADLGGVKRRNAVGFAANGKGYIGLGYSDTTATLLRDIWEYDPLTDTWTQKADFGGTERFSSTVFVIGDIAYVGLGSDQYSPYSFRDDFWKYNTLNNTWTSVANFPGTARYECKAFSIGTKGYIGTGWNQASYFNDFWEYDSSNNSWTQLTSFPGTPREGSIGFSINGYGYLGVGLDNSGALSDLYKYDPGQDIWSPIADFPVNIIDPVYFVIGNKAYIGSGSVAYPNLNLTKHFWAYDPDSNAWSPIADIGGNARISGVGFAIDSVGYCGTGGYGNATYNLNDFWKYAPVDVGINEIGNELNAIVYPNPAKSEINIHMPADFQYEAIRIMDIAGREVYNETHQLTDHAIPVSTWNSGVYFYKLTKEKVNVYGKFVKE